MSCGELNHRTGMDVKDTVEAVRENESVRAAAPRPLAAFQDRLSNLRFPQEPYLRTVKCY